MLGLASAPIIPHLPLLLSLRDINCTVSSTGKKQRSMRAARTRQDPNTNIGPRHAITYPLRHGVGEFKDYVEVRMLHKHITQMEILIKNTTTAKCPISKATSAHGRT